jgi:hypothetical protein
VLQNTAAIGVLRICSSESDPRALRLAVDRQLQGVELSPPGLPPSALLVVRSLVDPLPGRLGMNADRFRPPQAWSDAVRDRLDGLLSDAERPGSGALSSRSSAILFADSAELAACLVRDLVRGVADDYWWWQRIGVLLPDLRFSSGGLFEGADPAYVLAVAARDMPSIFASLWHWRAASEVAAAMDRQQTRRLLHVLATAHGLDVRIIGLGHVSDRGVGSVLSPTEASEPMPSPRAAIGPDNRAVSRQGRGSNAVPAEPWLPWLPAAVDEEPLSLDQRCLVGLALMLHRAPAAARQPWFVREADAWWRGQERGGRLDAWSYEVRAAAGASSPSDTPRAAEASALSGVGTGQEAEKEPNSVIASTDRLRRPAVIGTVQSADTASYTGRDADAAASANLHGIANSSGGQHRSAAPSPVTVGNDADAAFAQTGASRSMGIVPQDPGRAGRSGSADYCPAPPTAGLQGPPAIGSGTAHAPLTLPSMDDEFQPMPASPSPPVFSADQVRTRLGGVLYLIQALEDLQIPASFEEHWQLASGVGPWGALDLVARALLGEDFADHADDAVWTVLAALTPPTIWETKSPTDLRPEHDPPIEGSGSATWSSSLPVYRAPARWRAALAETEPRIRWAEDAGRLWLWSECGYVTASVARDERHPLDQAHAEVAAWAEASAWELQPGRAGDVPLAADPNNASSADLGFWATVAAPAVVRRLQLALDAEHQDRAALLRLLTVRGTLYLSPSHVDLVAGLDEIWLPARRAGLDRNPGWLADYGRVVLFHFQ